MTQNTNSDAPAQEADHRIAIKPTEEAANAFWTGEAPAAIDAMPNGRYPLYTTPQPTCRDGLLSAGIGFACGVFSVGAGWVK